MQKPATPGPTGRSFPLIVLTVVVILAYAIGGLRAPSLMDYDPAIGFMVWKSMESGAPFNHLQSVSHSDLSRDESQFMATYSPGQYLIPAGFTRLGVSLRTAVWLTTVLTGGLGLLGYYLLFRKIFGFEDWVAALSCLFLCLTRPVGGLFFEFTGGTLLEFAGIPYMIIGSVLCFRHRHTAWRLAVPLIFLGGAFLKLSMAVLSLSLCVHAAFLDLRDEKRSLPGRVARAAIAMAAFVIFYGVMTLFYTSKGWTAVSNARTGIALSTVALTIVYSIASLASGITSALAMLAYWKTSIAMLVVPIALLALFSIALLVWMLLRRSFDAYSTLLAAVSLTYLGAMTHIYLNGGAALDYRHFWLVGALLLPGVIEGLTTANPKIRAAAMAWGAVVCLFGMASTGTRALQDSRALRVGDFSYAREEREVAALIGSMEAAARPSTVIFANDPRVALLVRKSRLAFTSGDRFDGDRYWGTVESLVAIVESRAVQEKTVPRITGMFPGMSNWRRAVVGPFTVLVAGTGRPPEAIAEILRPL